MGFDYKALKERKVTWVFRAWVEDWKKEAIKSNDAVSEVRLLEKFKDLVFVEALMNKAFTIHSKNMEWYRSNKKRAIAGGWYLIGTHGDDVAESFAIRRNCVMTLQIHHKPMEFRSLGERRGKKTSRFKCSSMSMFMSKVSFRVTSNLFLLCNTTPTC